MFAYKFIHFPKFEIDTSVVDDVFKTLGKIVPLTQNGCLNLIFVSEQDIQKFNNDYRGKNEVTDVLSFHYFEDFSKLGEDDIAGELIFCESKIVSQGIEYGLGSEKEFYKLLIHSVLHILGYDHESDEEYEEMKKWEEKIWEKVFI